MDDDICVRHCCPVGDTVDEDQELYLNGTYMASLSIHVGIRNCREKQIRLVF